MGSPFIPMAASGGPAPVLLVEVLTAVGNMYFWSEHAALQPAALRSGAAWPFLAWLTSQPKFQLYGSTQTDTATFSVQNISGDTVMRDVAKAFSRSEFIGAYVVCRIWHGGAQQALFTFTGNIVGVDVGETQMDVNLEGFGNYSAIPAPAYNIDKCCPLVFGSVACGSTSLIPCDQSYGGCLQLNRFAGVVTQWDTETPNQQYAQPAPVVLYNPGRPF